MSQLENDNTVDYDVSFGHFKGEKSNQFFSPFLEGAIVVLSDVDFFKEKILLSGIV